MDTLFEIDDRDILHGWAKARGRRRSGAQQQPVWLSPGLRFAFYGRTSTAEFQDPVTSRAWQREMAESVIPGNGVITSEFFDVGCSRRVPWVRRPRAAVLLDQVQEADCGFDAVVVGEFERAFTDRQFHEVFALLAVHGVAVWLPEVGGPVDLADPDHRVLIAGARRAVAAGGGAVAAPDRGGDDRSDGRAGPVPRRSAAVRVSAGGRGAASESGARSVGTAAAAAGSGSGDRT